MPQDRRSPRPALNPLHREVSAGSNPVPGTIYQVFRELVVIRDVIGVVPHIRLHDLRCQV